MHRIVATLLLVCAAIPWACAPSLAERDKRNMEEGFVPDTMPWNDPLVATVIGTPPKEAWDVTGYIDQTSLSIRPNPDRELPGTLWTYETLRVDLACQDGPAKLVFVIAGTGATYRSTKMRFLQALFFHAGMHVVTISSPTSPDFLARASASGLAGISAEDAEALHKVMRMARDSALQEVEITGYSLTGYSLGGLDSAFVAELDSRLKVFEFEHVLLINPAVNLWTSVNLLDEMLMREMPDGIADLDRFLEQLLSRLSRYFEKEGPLDFDQSLLYTLQERDPLSDKEMRQLIGLSFRLTAADMVFMTDVLQKKGLIVDPSTDLGVGAPLAPYFKKSMQYDFVDYFRTYILPYWQQDHPGGTEEELIAEIGLVAIEDFLREAEYVSVVTNQDDIILDEDDHAFLRDVFGERVVFFPNGGHCGNINRRDFARHMLDVFDILPDVAGT